ncbi:MAG: hypothetical protein IT258_00420 [Saprospiraceae bacterium]|nr:hypothetical protein [Saprospiraceae bacterium]
MTEQEFFEIAGYFANPNRNTRIEIEGKRKVILKYSTDYESITGSEIDLDEDYVTLLEDDADKWGREMRIYFSCEDEDALPDSINDLKTVGGRHGYEQWSHRLNNRDVIDRLFSYGFRLGEFQDEDEIRASIPEDFIEDFENGYDID